MQVAQPFFGARTSEEAWAPPSLSLQTGIVRRVVPRGHQAWCACKDMPPNSSQHGIRTGASPSLSFQTNSPMIQQLLGSRADAVLSALDSTGGGQPAREPRMG